MNLFFRIVFIAVIFSISVHSQKISNQLYHPFSGTLVLSFEGGSTLEYTDFKGSGFDYFGRATLEYFFASSTKSSFGLRAFGGGGFISGEDTRFTPTIFRTKIGFLGGGIVYAFSLGEVVFPYLFAGVSNLWFDPKGEADQKLPNNLADVYKKNELNYNGELGFRFLITDNTTINLAGGVQISPNDFLDDIASGKSNDLFFTLSAGLSYAFFTQNDIDNDGVVDSKDICPNTPAGVKVDEFGCPLDGDKDGVADYLDKCLTTPKEVKVDKDGCPLDTDRDNIPDYMDLCSNTPYGVEVDEFGCPFDRDADGVPDYLDKCVATPYDVQVDANGCPIDSDKDGLPDFLDQCPDTPLGDKIDQNGCSVVEPKIVKEELKEITLSGSTNFGFNSAQLLPSAYPELDKLILTMKENPLSRWRIEGHTDNVGSAEGNKKISLMRAESVLNYFVSKGILKNRFEVVGLGKDFPIADNKTEEGRAKNRRVKIIKIN
ncbi:MAG TPA: OmpA family protein [Ignavibacteriaceae bacterium]|nr:OmpA family protein [Ignavibacteriaceae bacterium]